jgi:hypothetical protein
MTISIVDDRVVQEGGGEEFGGVIRIADIRYVHLARRPAPDQGPKARQAARGLITEAEVELTRQVDGAGQGQNCRLLQTRRCGQGASGELTLPPR